MKKIMTIKVYGRDIGVFIADKATLAKRTGYNDAVGSWFPEISSIVMIRHSDLFKTLIHELSHAILYFMGDDSVSRFGREAVCDKYSCFAELLIQENGDKIFGDIWKIAKENTKEL